MSYARVKAKTGGMCFIEAARFVMENPDWTLVHGRPTLQVPPHIVYDHAWVEKDGIARNANSGLTIPAEIFYALGKIQHDLCQRYSHDEMTAMLLKTEIWGPWKPNRK